MAAASVTSLEEIIATVKKKLTANRETILSSCHPWTPWALVELLDIPDFENFPAELILYKAFVTTRRRGIDISNDDGIQYKFKEVTKNVDIFSAVETKSTHQSAGSMSWSTKVLEAR